MRWTLRDMKIQKLDVYFPMDHNPLGLESKGGGALVVQEAEFSPQPYWPGVSRGQQDPTPSLVEFQM